MGQWQANTRHDARGSRDTGNDIDLDTREGVGTARGVALRFKGVPILYSPYLSFPISDARKSGMLTPEIGTGGRSGNEIRVPITGTSHRATTPHLHHDC